MRAFGWMQDLGRSAAGKVVALLLALAMVFSYSNIFVYSAKAFAVEEGSEVTTEETTETTEEEKTPEVVDTVEETTETENETLEGDIDETTNDVVEGEEGSEGEEDGQQDEIVEEPTEPILFDSETGTLVITGLDEVTASDVAAYKTTAKSIVINKVGTIEVEAFAEFKMESLEINDVSHIDKYSFRSCTNLKTLKIKNVNTIDTYAFYNPASLETIEMKNVETMGNFIFNVHGGKTVLKTVVLDNLNISDQMFKDHVNLSDLTMTNIGSIGFQSFMNCTGLTNLDLNGNVKEVGISAFLGCTGLTELEIDNVVLGNTAFYGCTGLKTATLKNMEAVPVQLFHGCTGLENVVLSDIKMLGSKDILNLRMFQDCSTGISLTLSNIDYVGQQAFVGAKTITKLALDNVGTVGVNAFASCTGIETATMSNIDTIGKYAFYNCTGLTTVKLDYIDTIGQYAFQNCTGLVTVDMDHIRFIDNYAFWNCKNLTTINSLSNVIERINGFTFYGCESLKGLTVDDLAKMGYVGSNEEIMKRVEAILAGKFNLDNAENIGELELDQDNWLVGDIGQSSNWQEYDNGTQIMQQARWSDVESGVAEVQVDAYYTGEKQMDYIFIADLSASMAQLGNPNDMNARFYDMQSKLLDMTSKLLNTPGYDCQVAIASFGGDFNGKETAEISKFFTDADSAKNHIQKLEPLYENTNYYRGLMEAYLTAKMNKLNGRNTVVVFLSDGAPNRGPSDDIAGESVAQQYKDLGIDIYGVLHSPAASQHDKALGIMNKICDQVYESTNTQEFGEAMNKAFTAVYGNNTITIPVNAEDFDVTNLIVTAGEVSYSDGIITWTLNGMPFTDHKLTYNLTLKEENANRVGTYTYSINNGNAAFTNENGAAAGIDLEISRTVEETIEPPAPVVPPTNPTVPTAPTTPTTPATVAPAAPATPAAVTPATPAAPVEAAPIEDDATPMAQSATGSTEESISDDENPLASVYDAPHCWIHYLIMLGMVFSVIYFAAVAIRRTSNDRKMGELERKLTEDREISYSASPAKHQA